MSPAPDRAFPQPAGSPGVTRFATRGEHRLSYELSGGDDGIPVLALHDLLAGRAQFRTVAEGLVPRGIRVIAPDARGHGASPMISGRRYPSRELAADALAILDAEGLAQTHVAAIGWGASTALALTVSTPERVASLVLADPFVPGLVADHANAELRQASAQLLELLQDAATAAEKGQIDRALDLFLGLRLGENWRDRLPKPRLAAIRRSAGNLGPLLTGITAEPFDRNALQRIDVPATILLRQDAPVLESESGEFLATLLPRGCLKRIQLEPGARSALDAGWTAAIVHRFVANGG